MADFSATPQGTFSSYSAGTDCPATIVTPVTTVYVWRGKTGGGTFVRWLTVNTQDPTGIYAPSSPLTQITLEGSFTR